MASCRARWATSTRRTSTTPCPAAGCCWRTPRSGWGRALTSRWSARTAPARPPCSGWPPGISARTAAPSWEPAGPPADPAAGGRRRHHAAARRADRQPRRRLGRGARGGTGTYQGTVLAVTHDRWFMRSFDRFLVFEGDQRVTEQLEPALP